MCRHAPATHKPVAANASLPHCLLVPTAVSCQARCQSDTVTAPNRSGQFEPPPDTWPPLSCSHVRTSPLIHPAPTHRREHNQRVLKHPLRLQQRRDVADALVKRLHHPTEDRPMRLRDALALGLRDVLLRHLQRRMHSLPMSPHIAVMRSPATCLIRSIYRQ